jgi:hypothetical protein
VEIFEQFTLKTTEILQYAPVAQYAAPEFIE